MTCPHPKKLQAPVISYGGSTIAVVCGGCQAIVESQCPWCRVTFKDLDMHLMRAKACQAQHQARFKTPKRGGVQSNL